MEESILDIIQSIQELKKTVNDLKEKQSSLQIQSGFWEEFDANKMENDLATRIRKSRSREMKKEITFDTPFNKEPKIHCGLAHIDTDSSANSIRISVVIDNLTKDGFTIKVQTWLVSRIFGFRVEWLAYTI